MHTTRPGRVHNKDVRAIEEFFRDRDSLSRQTRPIAKKKKKKKKRKKEKEPRILGVTIIKTIAGNMIFSFLSFQENTYVFTIYLYSLFSNLIFI